MAPGEDDDEVGSLRAAVPADADRDAPSSRLRRMVAQLVLDTTNEGIWLIDAQARTTFVNHAAAELLGYTEDEMIGMHIFDFMSEERRPVAQSNLIKRQRGVEDREQVQLRRKDGSSVWVIGSANPVYDRHGRYAGALGLFGDLTAQKENEARLRAQVDQLTAKLQEASQGASREAAREASPEASTKASSPRRSASWIGQAARRATALAAGGTYLGIVGVLAATGFVCAILGADVPPVMPHDY